MQGIREIAMSFLVTAGCVPAGSIQWPKAVGCAVPHGTIADRVQEVLFKDGVGTDRLSKASRKELETLALQYGADYVACTLSWLVDLWGNRSAKSKAYNVTLERSAMVRATQFMWEEGIR